MGCEPRRKKGRETVGHVAQARDCQQHAQNSRKERRPENEISEQEAVESEKYQAEAVALPVQLKRHECQRLQLTRLKGGQVARASQKDRRGEMSEGDDCHDGRPRKPEERPEQREASAYRLEQVIENERHGDIAHKRYELGCETQPK